MFDWIIYNSILKKNLLAGATYGRGSFDYTRNSEIIHVFEGFVLLSLKFVLYVEFYALLFIFYFFQGVKVYFWLVSFKVSSSYLFRLKRTFLLKLILIYAAIIHCHMMTIFERINGSEKIQNRGIGPHIHIIQINDNGEMRLC